MTSCCSLPPQKTTEPETSGTAGSYHPLIVMVVLVLAGSLALSWGTGLAFMPVFMGLFLLNFAMFKLFDIAGFAGSFVMYDIIGKRIRAYALVYPFIELALALGYLAQYQLHWMNMITAAVMGIGLIGIVRNQLSGNKVRCACMGSLIDVPVGSVTILENSTMILMALWCIFNP